MPNVRCSFLPGGCILELESLINSFQPPTPNPHPPNGGLMSRIELHCHTTASDGALTPTQLVELAHTRGITTLAITDHDTVNGLPEARSAAAARGIELLTGCEFGCELPDGEVHML